MFEGPLNLSSKYLHVDNACRFTKEFLCIENVFCTFHPCSHHNNETCV